MKITFDRSDSSRMVHIGDLGTIVIRWDGAMIGMEWCPFSVTIHLGPVILIVYA